MTETTSSPGVLLRQLRDMEQEHARVKNALIEQVAAGLKQLPEISGVNVLSREPFCASISSRDLLRGNGSWSPGTYDSQGQYKALIEMLERLPLERAINVLREIVEQGYSSAVDLKHGKFFHTEVCKRLGEILDAGGLYRFVRMFVAVTRPDPLQQIWRIEVAGLLTEDDEAATKIENLSRTSEAGALALARGRAQHYLNVGRTPEVTVSLYGHEVQRYKKETADAEAPAGV